MEDLLIASESSSKDIQHEIDIKNEYETENRLEIHDIIGLPSESDTLENELQDSDIIDGTATASNIDSYYSQNKLEVNDDAKEVVDDNEENEVVDNDDEERAFEKEGNKKDLAVEDVDVNGVKNGDDKDKDKDEDEDKDKDEDEDKDKDEDEDESNDDKSEENNESDGDDVNNENENENENEFDNNDDNDNENDGKEEESSSQIKEDSSCRINISALKVMRNIL